MIDPIRPVFVCLVNNVASQEMVLCDLLVNLDHSLCGWFMLRRYNHVGQVRV